MGRMAASDRATLRKSSRPSPGFRLSGRSMGAATTSTAITGNPVKNTEPHQKSWSKTPPTTGPMAVLGPLAVWTSAGEPVTVPGLKVRALLADLLVHAGQPVAADRLVDDLWGERPPADPAGALQVKVSQLRRVLAAAEPDGRELVEYRPPGYLLRAGGDAVDAHHFQALVTRARAAGDPRVRTAMLTDALSLWRGNAFADFSDQLFARASITRLEEERLAALEEQAE